MGVCRLCLQTTEDTGIQNPKETLQTFQKFLIHMNRTLINTPVICETCFDNVNTADKLLKAKNETDLQILKELKRLKVTKIDLRGFHKNVNIQSIVNICRICLKVINRPWIFLYENSSNILPHYYIRNMLKFCNIQMNLEVSEKPMMCSTCWEYLQITYSFKKEYLEVERKIKIYCQEFKLGAKKLTIEMLEKVQNYFSDGYCEIISTPNIKEENVFCQNVYPSVKKEDRKTIVQEHTAKLTDLAVPKLIGFKEKDNLDLIGIYLEVTNNEREFHPGYWKNIAEKWAQQRPDKPVPINRLGTQITRIYQKKLLESADFQRLKAQVNNKRQLQTQKSQNCSDSTNTFTEKDSVKPKLVAFKRKDNLSLIRIYFEVTNNEEDFQEGYWKNIADKWAEMRPDKPASVERLGSQLQRIYRKNLLRKADFQRLRSEVNKKKKLQALKSQELERCSDSDDLFTEEGIQSSFINNIKLEPLSESDIELNSLEPKLELESDCESLPQLERMDLPPLNFKIEKIYSLGIKREAYDNYMRHEDEISKIDAEIEELNKTRRKGLRHHKYFFKCQLCDFETKFPGSAEKHIRMHRSGKRKFYECTRCPYRISTKWLFNRHMKIHDKDDEIPVLQPSVYYLFD